VSARRPRALRTRLLLAIVAGVGLALVLIVVAFNVALARSLANDADEIVRARAASELASLRVSEGGIDLPPQIAGSGVATQVWIFDGARPLRAPAVDAETDAAARSLATGPERGIDAGDDTHLYALPIVDDGRRVGTIVTGLSLAPYNRTRVIALIASTALALVVLSAVAIASAIMLRAALRPVSRMTEDAANWSERDLDHRFDVGPPHDEITRLAATLDGLLDRLAAGFRRERRLTAEVSHELRTPLSQITAEVDLALRRERQPAEYRAALEQIRAGAERIEATVETLMITARQEGGLPRGTGDARLAATHVVAACAPLASRHGVSLTIEDAAAGSGTRAGVESQVIERILQPIVENACRYARAWVRVAVTSDTRVVTLEVLDDGPGVADGEEELIFEPGVSGSGDGAAREGAGLGLPLARRLARAAGGDVQVRSFEGRGHFDVRLPVA
jgi:two-component system OmpR family sensor kinase